MGSVAAERKSIIVTGELTLAELFPLLMFFPATCADEDQVVHRGLGWASLGHSPSKEHTSQCSTLTQMAPVSCKD